MPTMEGVIQDVRVALRQLERHRAFSVIVLVTLALGIGATSTFFSILNAVAFRPLPFPDPHRLISIQRTGPSGISPRIPFEAFDELRNARNPTSSVVAYVPRMLTLSGRGPAEQAPAAEISGDLFALLGIPLQLGRSVEDADHRAAVISHDVWMRAYGSDRAVLGAEIVIDGATSTIVGVAPAGFGFPSDARVWVPLSTTASSGVVEAVGRLNEGISVAQADSLFRTVAVPAGMNEREASTLRAVPLREVILGSKQRDAALVLLAASALVLAIACANLAGLFLAHISRRRHEMAVRTAIGAGRGRLVRQFMTESVLLALVGGLLGAILAQWGTDLFVSTLGKPGGAEWMAFTVDRRVVLFAMAVSLATSLFFGMAPAIGGSRVDIRSILHEAGGSAGGGIRSTRLRSALVVMQIALSLGLVAGGAAIVMSALNMRDVYPGFDREGLFALRVPLWGAAYDHPESRIAFVDDAVARIVAVPGVSSVTAVSHAPLIDRNPPATRFSLAGWSVAQELPHGSLRFVDPHYFAVMRIPIRRGRTFTDPEARDPRGTAVVINETMARRYWAESDVIGSRFRLPGAANPDVLFTVIGVVGDVAQRQLPGQPENQMYFPLPLARTVTLIFRAPSEEAAVAARVRDAVRGIDEAVAVVPHSMAGTYRAYARDRQLQGLVLGALGLVAVLVAALGIYGVMSLMVAERTREIAIRSALGGSKKAILKLVLSRAFYVISIGVAGGLLVAGGVTAFLSSIFFGLQPFDPRVFAAAATLLAGVGLGASWWPAREASRVDPMSLLQR
jgi:putative ABC transport system permease protein